MVTLAPRGSSIDVTPPNCGACQLASAGRGPVRSIDCLGCDVAALLAGSTAAEPDRSGASECGSRLVIAIACMATAALMWGTSFYFIAIALTGFDAVTITLTRCLIGGLVVGGLALAQGVVAGDRARVPRPDPSVRRGTLAVSLALAAAGTALALLGVAVGQQTVTSSVAGIVLGTVPVWTAAIVVVRARLRREGVDRRGQGRLVVALVLGMTACALPVIGTDASATAIGVAVLLGAALSHAISMVAVPVGIRQLGPLRNTSLVMLAAALLLAPLAFVGTRQVGFGDTGATLALLEVGILPTGIAYVAFFRAIAVLGAQRATMAIYLIPVVAMVTGTGIGGDPLTIWALAGGICGLAAVAFAVVPRRPPVAAGTS